MLERTLRSLSAALCVLPVALAVLYLLTDPGFAEAAFLYGLGCAFVGAAAGRLLGKRHPALQIAAAALPAAALAFALDYSIPYAGIARIAAPALGALLAVWAERRFISSESLQAVPLLMPLVAMLVASAVLWLAQADSGAFNARAWTVLFATGSVWLAVAMFALNRVSLRQATRAQKRGDMPPGMRRGGTLGVLAFVAAAFALANATVIARFIGAVVRKLIEWIAAALIFLTNLFDSPAPEEIPAPDGEPMVLPPVDQESSPLREIISRVIIGAVLLAVAAGIVYGLYKLLPRLWRKFAERMGNLFATWREEDEGYSDRAERLMSLRQAVSNAGARLKRMTRVFRRRPRLGDFPTNAGKARFLFREFLHGLISGGKKPAPGMTATEIARDAEPLARAYNIARYAGEEPTGEEIERAKESMHFKS